MPSNLTRGSPPVRWWVGVGLGIPLVILSLLTIRLASISGLPPATDFAMYWAAGRLNAFGENPYDPENVFPLERQIDPKQANVFIMYSPPWTLTLLMPFGVLDVRVSQVLWLLFHIVVIFGCVVWIWCLYGGPVRYWWLPPIIAFTFVPALLLLRTGQIGSLILLGTIGFLHFEKHGEDLWAGAMLALTCLKPHIVYLLLLGVLLWVIRQRRWYVLLGCCLTGLATAC